MKPLRLIAAALLLSSALCASAQTYTISSVNPKNIAAGSAGASLAISGTLPSFSSNGYGVCFYTGYGSTAAIIPSGSAAGYTVTVPASTIQQVPAASFTSGNFAAKLYVALATAACNGNPDGALTNTQTVTLTEPMLSGLPVPGLPQTNANLSQPPPYTLVFTGSFFSAPMTASYTWTGGSGSGTVHVISANSAVVTVPSTVPSTAIAVNVTLCNHTTSFDYCSTALSIPVSALHTSSGALTAIPNPATIGQTVALTAQFTGTGTFSGAPTGTVTFTANGSSIGTGKLVLDTAATFNRTTNASVSATSTQAKLADLNSDGLPDIIFFDSSSNLHVLLAATPYGSYASETVATVDANCGSPNNFVVGDLNGDGFPDIVLSCSNSGGVTTDVLLGNGDGTFAAPIALSGISATQLALADVDHDGVLDLIVAGQLGSCTAACVYGFQVFKGKGSGGFTADATSSTSAYPGSQLLAIDVDHDGNVDLLELNNSSPTGPLTVDVYRGVAGGSSFGTLNGTYYVPTYQLAVGAYPATVSGMVTADFNGDGLPDIALIGSSGVVTALNTSTATAISFATAQTTTASGVNALAVGDFNGDGYADFAIKSDAGIGVYDSDGAGNFGKHYSGLQVSGVTPFFVLAGDINADKDADLVLGVYGNSVTSPTQFVQVYLTSGAANASLAKTFSPGTIPLTATWPGNFVFSSSIANTSLVVNTAATTTNLSSSGTPTQFGQNVTFTAGVSSTTAGTLTGTVTFKDGSTTLGTVTLSVGSAIYTTASLTAGTHSITATYSGDASFSTSTSATVSQVVNQAQPTIAWVPSPTSIVYGTALVAGQLNATASSTYVSSVAGTFTYTPALGAVLGAGLQTLSVSFTPSDATDFKTAAGTASITVTRAMPTITWLTPSPIVAGTPLSATQLNATAAGIAGAPSPLPGSYVYNPALGTVLAAGNQPLNVTFTPTDATDYATATGNVTLSVLALSLTSVTPNTASLGDGAKAIALTGIGFLANSIVQVNGTPITTTYVSGTSLTAVIPAAYFLTVQTLSLMVNDPTQAMTSAAVTVPVVAPAPVVTFTGPSTSQSSTQPTLTFTLTNPYPVPLTGTLTLSFAGSITDPALQFAAGGTTQTFTVPALSTTVPTVQLQTGTVAGTITVALTLVAGGANVTPASVQPITIVVAPAVPSETSITLTRSGKSLTIAIHGFSNTRELTQATFHFNPTPGNLINNPDIVIQAATLFNGWYSQVASNPYGSTFTYTQPFTLSNDADTVGSVTVTLTNSVGVSTTGTVQ
jgi:hypothetical protein